MVSSGKKIWRMQEDFSAMAIMRMGIISYCTWTEGPRSRGWMIIVSILTLAYLSNGQCDEVRSATSSSSICSPTRRLDAVSGSSSSHRLHPHWMPDSTSSFRANSPVLQQKFEDLPIAEDGHHRSLSSVVLAANTLKQMATTKSTKDGETLLELKKNLTYDGFNFPLSDWVSANLSKMCSWTGVSCNNAGRVGSLNLTGMQLYGTLCNSMDPIPGPHSSMSGCRFQLSRLGLVSDIP